MAYAKFRAIIFDIGRVLIRVDISRAMEGLASSLPLSPEEVWSAIEKDPHWLDWQEGRISPLDWHLHLTRRLGASLTFEQFIEVWYRALARIRSIRNRSWRSSPRTTASPCYRIPIPSTCPTERPASPFSASFPSVSIPIASARASLTRSCIAKPSKPAESRPRKRFISMMLPPTRKLLSALGCPELSFDHPGSFNAISECSEFNSADAKPSKKSAVRSLFA